MTGLDKTTLNSKVSAGEAHERRDIHAGSGGAHNLFFDLSGSIQCVPGLGGTALALMRLS